MEITDLALSEDASWFLKLFLVCSVVVDVEAVDEGDDGLLVFSRIP